MTPAGFIEGLQDAFLITPASQLPLGTLVVYLSTAVHMLISLRATLEELPALEAELADELEKIEARITELEAELNDRGTLRVLC